MEKRKNSPSGCNGESFKSDPQTRKLIRAGRVSTTNAIRASRALGLPITYLKDGKIYKEFEDGTKEVISSNESKVPKKITDALRKGMIFHGRK